MYGEFYGLKEKPFNLTPDPRFFFLSDNHRGAFEHLLYGIKEREGYNFFFDHLPAFAVATGPVAEGPFWYESEIMNLPSYKCAVHQELAQDILRRGAENGIQFSQVHEFKIDHAFTVPLSYVRPEQDIPMVPIISNAFGYPIPSNRRWYALGQLIQEVIDARPADERIAVIGSFNLTVEVGGPKMGNYNHEFNRWVIEQMREGGSKRPDARCLYSFFNTQLGRRPAVADTILASARKWVVRRDRSAALTATVRCQKLGQRQIAKRGASRAWTCQSALLPMFKKAQRATVAAPETLAERTVATAAVSREPVYRPCHRCGETPPPPPTPADAAWRWVRAPRDRLLRR